MNKVDDDDYGDDNDDDDDVFVRQIIQCDTPQTQINNKHLNMVTDHSPQNKYNNASRQKFR